MYLPSLKLMEHSVLELSVAQLWFTNLNFDLDLWPTDLVINRDHLLMKDYLPIKFEASGAKPIWVISCTRCGRPTWPLTLTFDLLTWILIGIIYSSKTIYIPSLKFPGQNSRKASWVISCTRLRETDKLTDGPTDTCKEICPSFFEGGGGGGGIKMMSEIQNRCTC